MVELSAVSGGGYRVERYAIEALPREAVADGNIANLEAVSEAIRRAWVMPVNVVEIGSGPKWSRVMRPGV